MNSGTDNVISTTDGERHAIACKAGIGSEKNDIGGGIVAVSVPICDVEIRYQCRQDRVLAYMASVPSPVNEVGNLTSAQNQLTSISSVKIIYIKTYHGSYTP